MPFNNVYHKARVFITGHTGFKGSWLTVWLNQLGANICGYSNGIPTTPSHYALLRSKSEIRDEQADTCDYDRLLASLTAHKPEIVFHLASQSIVKFSYDNPLTTYSSNVMGAASLLQACRFVPSIKAIVVITSDKVYDDVLPSAQTNVVQMPVTSPERGYKETDVFGGHDPYSASKACVELVAQSFCRSFFQESSALLATCRAGNVIGGGDWSLYRLIPDLIRNAASNQVTQIRMPHAIRPWQHVLEVLYGYLLLGQKLLEGKADYSGAWNFSPDYSQQATVREILEIASRYWEQIRVKLSTDNFGYETACLILNSDKAGRLLGWEAPFTLEDRIAKTIRWYKSFYNNGEILTIRQLNEFMERYCGVVGELKLAG